MYWSVQRELWENRSIYLAPLVVQAVVLFGFLISMFTLPRRMQMALALDAVKQNELVTMPFHFAAGLPIVTAFIVGVFYCLDALHGERRDRSILFWKSLPVSDRTSVFSKACVPLIILPLFIFAIIVAAQMIMLGLSTVVLLGNGPAVAMLWTNVKFFQSSVALLYALIAIALWHAPIYGWLLLLSAWARRATFLWAVLPLLAIGMFEQIAFRTTLFASLLKYRLIGWFTQAFVQSQVIDPLMALTPGKFLSTPGLWIGLIAAAIFVAAAVWLRHHREPI
ncbi:MAG: ABC transporter permease [Acidobacteria bacterium]|nr:MAG: ABC transporter permease [Acidobacteriota bacterium]